MNPYELIRRLIALVVALIQTPRTDEAEIARLHTENADLLKQLQDEKDNEARKDGELQALVPDIENALALATATNPPTPGAIEDAKNTIDSINLDTGKVERGPINPTDMVDRPPSGVITSTDDPRHPSNKPPGEPVAPEDPEVTIANFEKAEGRPATDDEKKKIRDDAAAATKAKEASDKSKSEAQEKIAKQEAADKAERDKAASDAAAANQTQTGAVVGAAGTASVQPTPP